MILPRTAQGSDHLSNAGTGTSSATAVPTAETQARSTGEMFAIKLAHSSRQTNATVNCGIRVPGTLSLRRLTA
jgi:hypothetical protein